MKKQTLAREEIQRQALQALKDANGVGTLHIMTGVGKTKITIDFIKYYQHVITDVLVLVPLTRLVQTWLDEFVKWSDKFESVDENTCVVDGIKVVVETVQTAYRWSGRKYDLVVYDECHKLTSTEYSKSITGIKSTFKIGLTATPDLDKEAKQLLYNEHLPIIYEYLEGEADGVVNQIKYVIIENFLHDTYRLKANLKGTMIDTNEAEHFYTCTRYLENMQQLMANLGSTDFFEDAKRWWWERKGKGQQLEAGRKYLSAVHYRKSLLLNLPSNREIARQLIRTIRTNEDNKVLVFSEQVEQVKKICQYVIHGKQKPELNKKLVERFNAGEIKALGNCYMLTHGVNLVGVNNCIIESYQGSNVNSVQRIGRLHRLESDEIATIYIIKVVNTPVDRWFTNMMKGIDLSNATILKYGDVIKWEADRTTLK